MLLQELGLLFLFLSFPLSLSDPVYMVIGGDAVLRPVNMDLLIKNIEWKHNEDIAAEWFGDKVVCFGQFEGRCEVNTDTGALIIKGLNLNDRGIYTPEINGKVFNKIELSVISRVAKPSVKTSCNNEMTNCLLTCEGNTADAKPIIYQWFVDGRDGPLGDQLIITEDTKENSFSCLMKNPVSNETSESITNPFRPVLVYGAKGEDVILRPPPMTETIERIEWKHNENVAARWYEDEFECLGQFEGRCEVDIDAGELTIRNISLNDSGIYTPEINDKVFNKIQLSVIPVHVYGAKGEDVILRPPPMTDTMQSIEWKHNETIAAGWYGDEFKCLGLFEGRCEVNTGTGELTIKGLNLNDSGIYTPEINGNVFSKTQLSVISHVAKPSVKTSCDTLKTDCLFTCEGNTAEAEPITYTWFIDGKQGSSYKELIIREGFGFALSGFRVSCLMKNPVSNETSESVINPVTVVSISITVAASIVVGVATYLSQKRIIEIWRITSFELWRTRYGRRLLRQYVKELRALYKRRQRTRKFLSILALVVIVLVVTLVGVIFYIMGIMQGDQYILISILAPVVIVSVVTLVGVIFFIRVIRRIKRYVPKSYLVSEGVVLVVNLVAPISLVIGITQADQYNWTSIIVPVVIVSVFSLVAEIFLLIRVIWRIKRYAKWIRKGYRRIWLRTLYRRIWLRTLYKGISIRVSVGVVSVVTVVALISVIRGITQADQYNWISILVPVVIVSVVALVAEIFLNIMEIWLIKRYEPELTGLEEIPTRVPVGVAFVVVLVALISLIIARGQGDQYIWISILVQAGGRLVAALVFEIVLIIMARRQRAQDRPEHEIIPLNPPPDGEGQPNTTQHPSNGAELTPVEVPDLQTCGPLDTNKDSENSVKMPEEKPETNCEPSADEQEADDREDKL